MGMHRHQDTGEWIGHDCHVREDMFDNPGCVWKFGPINQKVFEPYNQNHETFKIIRQLSLVQSQSSILQTGDRTVLSSEEHGLRSVIIHDTQGSPPLVAIMNLGTTQLTQSTLAIPPGYGEIQEVDIQVATVGSTLQQIGTQIHCQLPPFAFILVQLFNATTKPYMNHLLTHNFALFQQST